MDLEPYQHRLRENVDSAALGTLLERIDPDVRSYLLTLCFRDPTPEELKAAALPWIERGVASGERSDLGSEHIPGLLTFFTDHPPGLRIRLDDPDLQALWIRASGQPLREA